VAFSCKQRCTCPDPEYRVPRHQKRALLTAIHVAEEVCFPVAHRQVVFTIPKRLRLHARFDRFTQHIPPKGTHLVRYYGWYSNKARGMRKKAAANLPSPVLGRGAGGEGITSRASQTWAMLIKRVYEVDPLECPKCGGTMKVIAFIEPRAPDGHRRAALVGDGRGEVIEKILRHCGLWQPSTPRAPPPGKGRVHDPDGDSDGQTASSDEPPGTHVRGHPHVRGDLLKNTGARRGLGGMRAGRETPPVARDFPWQEVAFPRGDVTEEASKKLPADPVGA
jgi:hypothetical protein